MIKREQIKLVDNAISSDGENEFSTKFMNDNVFTNWLLMDFTRFSVARLRDYELAKIGTTPEQAAILQILVRRDGKATISEISEAWMRRPHSVSTLARRMEKQGLVSIVKYPKRKELKITITDKGSRLFNKLTRSSIEAVYSVLSPEDRRQLAAYLRRLLDQAINLLKVVDK